MQNLKRRVKTMKNSELVFTQKIGDRCRIVAKNHIVSSVVTEFTVNGVQKLKFKRTAHLKPRQAHTGMADRVVFNAMHEVGCDWADVNNYLDKRCTSDIFELLDKKLDRHTV
jgi:hypothetical protein